MTTMKTAMAVVAGYVVWTLLWLIGNQSLIAAGWLPKDPRLKVESMAGLAGLLALSIACYVSGGALARRLAKESWTAVPILAGLLLVTGLGVQWSIRELMPVWYHLVFLLLLIPATYAGAFAASKN
jgi:hypothetical protein